MQGMSAFVNNTPIVAAFVRDKPKNPGYQPCGHIFNASKLSPPLCVLLCCNRYQVPLIKAWSISIGGSSPQSRNEMHQE